MEKGLRMPDVWSGNLEKIDEFRWRIPKSYKNGMRVDGVIYANEALIEDIRHDKAPEQVANVAFLPGIVKYSLAMPDIHWGYGFSIGGVAATDIENGGVITPGGVGYDINCLPAFTNILSELGYKRKIKDFEKCFSEEVLKCMNFSKEKEESTKIKAFLKQKPKNIILNIITKTGKQITATEDHPFYTKDGMKPIGKLKLCDEIATYSFEGIDYKDPSSDVIVGQEDIRKILLNSGITSKGNATKQILTYLDKKEILPIRYNSAQLPYLLKIMGYCLGDGSIHFVSKTKNGVTCFYGKKEDLDQVRADIEKIGFKASLYSRDRHHKIKTAYSTYEFDRQEDWLKVASTGFAALLIALGVPSGNKCRQAYNIPKWLFRAPLWQKRLFLAGFFGAEMSSPKTLTGHGYNFYCPTVSMNKTEENIENGRRFLNDIRHLLVEFDIDSHEISQRKEFVNKNDIVPYRLRLMVSDQTENLINLYSKIGFEYNKKRAFLANAAIGYLRLKKRILNERKQAVTLAPKLKYEKNWETSTVYNGLSSEYVSQRFIERSLYEVTDREPRLWGEDLTFDEYIKIATEGLGQSGMAWDKIESVSEIEYDDYVYDFTVAHEHHNFIADGFVVSNCGVRLMRTDLTEAEVKPVLEKLVYGLFNNIPAGVGSKGDIKISEKQEQELLVEGAGWVVKHGYGASDDLEYTEERGAIKGADSSAVSERAYERGKKQSGTLGSGNHFIEVQVIDEVYDDKAAGIFDLKKNDITVMIHSGSRGLGYQVCDDYARGMMSCLLKYNINVPDKQLACAPVNSKEGKEYLGAMRSAANYAWANRQCLMHLTRNVFEKIFNKPWHKLGMFLIYDVAHNIAKIEKHDVDGKEKLLCVHRKGATRAFGPGHPDLPVKYKKIGQPVIIPGDMGRNSYLLVGTEKAKETFFSTCHGAGRVMSRTEAINRAKNRSISQELAKKGIIVKATGRDSLAEEMPDAYKDVNDVVNVVAGAGIAKRVCKIRPLGVIKG